MRPTKTITHPLCQLGASLMVLFCGTVFSAGCFTEPKPECAFACASDDDICPEDYRCVSDGWCKRNDIAFDFQCSPAVLIDAATFDSARPDADTTDADTTDADTTDADTPDSMPMT